MYKPGDVFKDCPECPEMVVIPPGSFRMGDLNGGHQNEKPVHDVRIDYTFAVGRYEVMQAEYKTVMGINPSQFKGSRKPVDSVSWNNAKEFVRRLSTKTGKTYRLLSEAEWEYMARAGSSAKYPWGNDINSSQANYHSSNGTTSVGSFSANSFGVYDTVGNVWEWVEDCWHGNYNGAPSEGAALTSGGDCRTRIHRGGSWVYSPRDVRSATRFHTPPATPGNDRGFRLARTLTPETTKKTQIAVASPKVAPPTPTIAKAQPQEDTSPPRIDLPGHLTASEDTIKITGRVTDDSEIAALRVRGKAIKIDRDGSFTVSQYVPAGGLTTRFEAVDVWGNRSERTIKITRAVVKVTDSITFESLNPTTISGRSNSHALALVIGVGDYEDAPAAKYADADAQVFSDYARRALGVSQSNLKILVNEEASRTKVKLALKLWLRGRIEADTDVYVFFAGHGLATLDGETLYLLPYDGAPSLLDETAILRNELFEVISKAKPRSATFFMDTCYSGLSRGEEMLLASARPIQIVPKSQQVPTGFTVFSAASGQQISSGLDETEHGLFSYYLMKGMEGPADANGDRRITAGELHGYVRQNVQQQAIRLGREQTPEMVGDAERVLVAW